MKAVCVRNAVKQYGTGKQTHAVLQGLDMTVHKGTIYGLLGASGCGKTTLLTCIVGRRRLGSGDIWVLGGKPGSRGSGVPGPRLGYMPQELSLMREFSVRDALQHFAWIYNISQQQFEERYQFLQNLLDLPPGDTRVKNLSGGQQRRTSLAVALVHDPELLILDEPTVGLDPVLRQNIWDHLLTIAGQGKTIIITTHYIEEASQAHAIGLMRNGKLLAEGSPADLIRRFNCVNIENVFLQLSEKQEGSKLSNASLGTEENLTQSTDETGISTVNRAEFKSSEAQNTADHDGIKEGASCNLQIKNGKLKENKNAEAPSQITKTETQTQQYSTILPDRTKILNSFSKLFFQNKGHAKALLTKNTYRILRNPGAILFIILFPMLEICTFFFAVGGWPKGMKIGIVNEELGVGGNCLHMEATLGGLGGFGGTPNTTYDGLPYCSMQGLSCKFINLLNDSIAGKVYFDDLATGLKEAQAGHVIGLLYFASNYTQSFEARIDQGSDISNETVDSSELLVWMDMSQRQSALLVEQKLRETHKEFMKVLFKECEIPEKVGTVPLNIHKPIHGSENIDYSLFMTPGVIITMIFFISVGVTAMIIVVERLDGIWDRTLCAGITSREILLSHIIVEAAVILMQAGQVFLFVFYIFNVPCLGSYFHIIILLFLQGFTGMCGGFLVSVSCNSITASNFVSMGSFYPVLILSGLLWPIEGMPPFLRSLALGMPTTLATTALRNIMEKGWGMFHNYVYQGYIVSIVWIIVFSSLSLTVVKLRK